MLPFTYALRNLFRDKSRLLQTVGGSALVVLLVMAAGALNHGMTRALAASGHPLNTILLGAGSEESMQRSEIPERAAGIAEAAVQGVARPLGVPAVSTEIQYMTYLTIRDGRRAAGVFRGVTPQALLVHGEVRLLEGRFPQSGELLVGRLAWRRFHLAPDDLKPGEVVRLDGAEMTISGVFAAPGSVLEAEIWAPLSDIRMLAQRDTVSCVTLRMETPEDFAEADLFSKQRLDLELVALRESDYYANLARFFAPLRWMTWITAGLVAAGALFGGLNTLYAAFAPRIRELATLQAIGFSRRSILLSLVQESLLACLAGTLLAAALAVLLLEGITVPFSIGAFTVSITPRIAVSGIVTGVLLGVVGALAPALRCLRPPLPSALRAG